MWHVKPFCEILQKRKRVKEVKQEDDSDSSSEFFIGNVNHKEGTWKEVIEIEGQKVKTKLDTGADVNIIPLQIFKRVNRQFRVWPADLRRMEYISTRYYLPYGLSDSQNLFEEEVEKRFGNIDNVIIYHDDMIISGATKQENDTA
ncbi:hypothetical protein QE152_g25265 [Popillia japonica]|uniref:Uncharacterized protein n=1 Tax=Popillia japonica TaxID=7064 RepID=A0AAW1K0N4_POPJA